jgi:hypothetical protein
MFEIKGIVTLSHVRIITPYYSLKPDSDNKDLHSIYKRHIVRDREQIQSEMNDHN